MIKNRKTIKLICFLLLIVFGLTIYGASGIKNEVYSNEINEVIGSPIRQNITIPQRWNGLKISISSFDNSTDNINVSIEDGNQQVVQKWIVNDHSNINKILKLDKTLDAGDYSIVIDGTLQSSNVRLSIYRIYNNYFLYLALLFITIGVVILLFCSERIDKSIVLLVTCGLCMLCIMAPFSCPDEKVHYYSTLELSNIIMGNDDVTKIEGEYYNYYTLKQEKYDYNEGNSFVTVLKLIKNPLRSDNSYYHIDTNDNIMLLRLPHPIQYLPAATGVTIARLLRLNIVWTIYAGRLTSLLIYIFIVYGAIRYVPHAYKDLLSLIACLPLCMQQAGSFSYDMMSFALSFLFVSYVVHLYMDADKVSFKDCIFMIVVGCLLAPIKIVYAILVLMVLVIPNDKFINKKDKIVKTATLIVSVTVMLIVVQLNSLLPIFLNPSADMSNNIDNNVATVTTINYTIGYAIKNPLVIMKIVINSIDANFITRLLECFSKKLSGRTIDISDFVVLGFIFIIIISVLGKNKDGNYKKSRNIIIVGVCLITISAIFATGLIMTAEGDEILRGIQGRYYIPLIFPLLITLDNVQYNNRVDKETLYYLYYSLYTLVCIQVMSQIYY